MFFYFLVFTSCQFDMYEDSFVLINRNYPNMPLTIYNYKSDDITLPLRLSDINENKLFTQLFTIRFDSAKNFWLSNIIVPEYRSINSSPYLVARTRLAEPNLTLKRLRKTYNIISDDKCMTLGSRTQQQDSFYFPLEFTKCTDDSNQEFVFVPRIVVEYYLKNIPMSEMDTDKISFAYKRLNTLLSMATRYRKNKNASKL